jgi:hypothetical protein
MKKKKFKLKFKYTDYSEFHTDMDWLCRCALGAVEETFKKDSVRVLEMKELTDKIMNQVKQYEKI